MQVVQMNMDIAVSSTLKGDEHSLQLSLKDY